MPTIEYDDPLDDEAQEWLRIRILTSGGAVTSFAVQYETMVSGERVPVVRYDNAHGFAHRDLLNRRGDTIDKRPLGTGISVKEAVALGEHDIRNNWRHYRANFFKDS